MKINEVGMGKDVIIEVSKGTNILKFESKSMEIVQDDLLIECVRYNNKVVNLASKMLSYPSPWTKTLSRLNFLM